MQPNVPNTQPGNNDQNKCAGCGVIDSYPINDEPFSCDIY